MAINIQNIVAALEAKVAAATSTTETQELIVIIKSIKAAGQQTVVTYGDVPNLPTASVDNAGNLAYVAAVGKIYYSNGTTWTEVGSGSSSGGGGTAYDQDLNTTDDVVFNSTLIGDVSIVGNTISGIDAYGLGSTLIVDGDLDVTGEFNVTSTKTDTITELVSYSVPNNVGTSTYYDGYNFQFNFPWSQEDLAKLTKIKPNTTVNFTTVNTQYFGNFNDGGFFSITSVTVLSSGEVVLNGNGNFVSNGAGNLGGSSQTVTFFGLTWNQSETVVSMIPTTPISVSSTGVNVEGEFTVNGQAIAGGSGSSYDQDLNTIDDVVFNSGLIGDVSIVGNTISGIDAYGLTGALVVDGGLTVTTTLPEFTTSYNLVGDPSGAYAEIVFGMFGPELRIYGADQSLGNKLLQVSNGSTITITSNNYGISNITLTSAFFSDPNTGGYTARVNQNPSNGNGLGTVTSLIYNITTPATDITQLAVTASGVAITGDLTLDDNSVTPTNTSTVVKWAKITVGGQVYFTPLYQ